MKKALVQAIALILSGDAELIDIIGITPIVAPKELLEKGLFKETKKCEIRYQFASVSLAIDYDAFIQGDVTEKK